MKKQNVSRKARQERKERNTNLAVSKAPEERNICSMIIEISTEAQSGIHQLIEFSLRRNSNQLNDLPIIFCIIDKIMIKIFAID